MRAFNKLGPLAATIVAVSLYGCGGGDSEPSTFAVGGVARGIAGSGLVLQLNSGSNLAISANGSFAFATPVANGASYSVAVLVQPTSPAQTCSVTRGTGTIANADVTNVDVMCMTNTYTVGGTVNGLVGTGLVLRSNLSGDLPIAQNGAFSIGSAILSGATYTVTVATQPSSPQQACTVSSGSGTVTAAHINSIVVSCTTTATNLGETPVAVRGPAHIQPLYSTVSFAPRFRVGATYVAGRHDISTLTSLTSAPLALVEDVITFAATNGVATTPGVYALSGRTFEVYAYRPTTGVLTAITGSNRLIREMHMNRREDLLLTVDAGPPLLDDSRGAVIEVWHTEDPSSLDVSRYRFSTIRSPNGHAQRCPCKVATNPGSFARIYAITTGSDTLTMHQVLVSGDAATGHVVVPSPAGTFTNLSQIVADSSHGYVTDSQGRLHVVTAGTATNGFLQVTQALTTFTIEGTLVRDEIPGSPYFFEVGRGPNAGPQNPSTIKVYAIVGATLTLVATIPTSTNALGPLAFGPTEVFFWDGTEIKAFGRGTWVPRTIPGAPIEAAANPLHYDDFDDVLQFGSSTRNVVFTLNARSP